MGKYALLLNDMRSSNIENIKIVKTADTRQELIDYYNGELADKQWSDKNWGKVFKKGSSLEWYNPVYDLMVDNDYWGGVWAIPDNALVGDGLVKFL